MERRSLPSPLPLCLLAPFSLSPRPPSLPLCPLPFALYNERGQGTASDTTGGDFGSRPHSGLFPTIASEPRFPSLDSLIFLSSDEASRVFLLHQSSPLTLRAALSCTRVTKARNDLSKLNLTIRSVVKQERLER